MGTDAAGESGPAEVEAELRALCEAYASAADRRDGRAFAEVFTRDGTPPRRGGGDESKGPPQVDPPIR